MTDDGSIFLAAESFDLPSDEVHVWRLSLDLPPARARCCEAWLSADERQRADRFYAERHRAAFVAARGSLRTLLGAYVGCAPEAIRFALGPHGKPRLASPSPEADYRFNLSHSEGQALIAITRGVEVGIDLEYMRSDLDCAGIVASQFSPAEQAAWAALAEAERRPGFYHGWVRKEAYAKARGEGLAHPPAAYTVDLHPESVGRLISDTLTPAAASAWTLQALPAPPGFAAAVAYAGPPRAIRWRAP